MNSTKLIELVEDFRNYYLNSPMRMEVKFGCECGCGGDSYSEEEWSELRQLSEESYINYYQYCIDNNIGWIEDYTS